MACRTRRCDTAGKKRKPFSLSLLFFVCASVKDAGGGAEAAETIEGGEKRPVDREEESVQIRVRMSFKGLTQKSKAAEQQQAASAAAQADNAHKLVRKFFFREHSFP